MANIESDATYCSEVEKEKEHSSQRRRSQRLSQKLSHSFRSNVHSTSQRFEDIHQMLKSNTTCNNWSKHDWLALRYEVGLILKSLKGIARSRIAFVQKKINQHLRQSSASSSSNVLADVIVERQDDNNGEVSCEAVKSPNILAGMTTDVFTELPPYQPDNISNIMSAVQRPAPSSALTQVNPLDLTKKLLEKPSDASLHKELLQPQSSLEPKSNKEHKNARPATKDVSKDLLIDLTDDIAAKPCGELPVQIVGTKPTTSKTAVHRSKWLKFIPTQQKPKALIEKPKPKAFIEKPNAPSLKDKPKSLKQSLVKLYNDHPTSNTKPKVNRSPSNPKVGHKPSKQRYIDSSKQRPLHNTESALGRHFEQPTIQQRNVQSDRMSSLSPDFFADELLPSDLMDFNDGDSMTSLPFSLKNSFKKIFGTDCLDDVFGCEKVIYSLTESHIGRLASALNVKCDFLKQSIEQILADDSAVPDNDVQSGSSVVECSQSPPHRLFPSQRSQVSK